MAVPTGREAYLEGTYSEVYPQISPDGFGISLIPPVLVSGGVAGHVAAESPGSIHEGGELGYSLSHAYGAAFDNPDLSLPSSSATAKRKPDRWQRAGIPTSSSIRLVTAWYPILHLNGYKIANPCVLARISHEELDHLFRGYGYTPYFVEGDQPEAMHELMAATLDKVVGEIQRIKSDAHRDGFRLIAGTTGSGKSVAINTMILSLVYRLRPEQCRLIMIDPKMLELSVYDGIPHLLTPVVTDPKKAVVALKWAVREMEERYKKMSKLGVRNIEGYNARLAEAKSKGETLTRTVHTGYDKETGDAIYEKEELELEPLPFLVVIVDEMADLMMVAGKDIEGAIQRLAQMARAAGIHVILATQRPSVDVITGTIKANFPTRISFQVTSKIDSRTILGEQGAEQLLGQGDMLYMAGGGRISRVHGPFVADDEVEKVVRHLKSQGVPQYLESVTARRGRRGRLGLRQYRDGRRRRRGQRSLQTGGADRAARSQGLHELYPAAAADRL